MYIAGRTRTASSPSRTLMVSAPYAISSVFSFISVCLIPFWEPSRSCGACAEPMAAASPVRSRFAVPGVLRAVLLEPHGHEHVAVHLVAILLGGWVEDSLGIAVLELDGDLR